MCQTGHRVVFNPPWEPEGSYIECIDTGEGMRFEEQGGLYVLSAKVAPKHKQTCMTSNGDSGWHQVSHWQGNQ